MPAQSPACPASAPHARSRWHRSFVTLAGVFFIPGRPDSEPPGLLKRPPPEKALTGTDGSGSQQRVLATFNQGIDGTEPAVPAAPYSRAPSALAQNDGFP